MATIRFKNMGYHVMGATATFYDENGEPYEGVLCISMLDGRRIYLPKQVIESLPSATGANWEGSDEV